MPSAEISPSAKISSDELLASAREAAKNSYSPYSRYRVGVAMLLEDGEVIRACNVENASYGLTVCAERSAVAVMVSQGKRNPIAIAVAGSHDDRDDYLTVPCPPCGACRQVLNEFNPDMTVILASKNGAKIYPLKKLLPHSFTLDPE